VVSARVRRRAKAVPCRCAVELDAARRALAFKLLEGGAQALVELFARDGLKLRLRVVDVVNVHGFEIHVAERLRELVREIARRHAVATADDVGEFGDARPHERLFDVSAYAGLTCGRLRIERKITALRADDD